jgi:hypothetical protein
MPEMSEIFRLTTALVSSSSVTSNMVFTAIKSAFLLNVLVEHTDATFHVLDVRLYYVKAFIISFDVP